MTKPFNMRLDERTLNRLQFLIASAEADNKANAIRLAVQKFAKQCGYNE
jgi:hypothetical protein